MLQSPLPKSFHREVGGRLGAHLSGLAPGLFSCVLLCNIVHYWGRIFKHYFSTIEAHGAQEERMLRGDRIKTQRQQQEMSQVELGRRIGQDHSYISKLEHGVRTDLM